MHKRRPPPARRSSPTVGRSVEPLEGRTLLAVTPVGAPRPAPPGGTVLAVKAVAAAAKPTVPAKPTPPAKPAPPKVVAGQVSKLTLINASTDTALRVLGTRTTIDLAAVGVALNVNADVVGTVKSVRFVLDGAAARVDSVRPFAAMGDLHGDFAAWAPPVGRHTLTVTPFAGANATGPAGKPVTVTLDVVRTPPPPADAFPTTVAWARVADNPVARGEAIGTVVGGKLYTMSGFDGSVEAGTDDHWVATARCDRYDPAADAWERLADMPEVFTHATAVVAGDVIWYVGGYAGNHPGPATGKVWAYDTVADTWARGPDLPAARGAGAAVLIGNTIYYTAGMEETRVDNVLDTWALDLSTLAPPTPIPPVPGPSDVDPSTTDPLTPPPPPPPQAGWVAKAAIPTGRNHVGAAVIGGKLYAVGGQLHQEHAAVGLATLEVYDPATDAWERKADLPAPRSHLTAGVLAYKGRLVVVGGDPRHDDPQRELFAYDPATDAWSVMGLLPQPRGTAVTGVLPDGRIVVSTGNGPGSTATTWVGTPR